MSNTPSADFAEREARTLYSVGVEQGRYRGFVHRGEGVDMTTDPVGPFRSTYGEALDDIHDAGGTIELSPLVRRLLGVAPLPLRRH